MRNDGSEIGGGWPSSLQGHLYSLFKCWESGGRGEPCPFTPAVVFLLLWQPVLCCRLGILVILGGGMFALLQTFEHRWDPLVPFTPQS